MVFEPNILSEDLAQSYQQTLMLVQAQQFDADRLRAVADTIAGCTLNLEPMPVDPVAHLQAAHEWARSRLVNLPQYDPAAVVFVGTYSYTPRKALRRVLDHALDHLNQIDQWLAWQQHGTVPTPTDGWVNSATMLDEDRLPLMSNDMVGWLWRIDIAVTMLVQRARPLTAEQLDWCPPDNGWTLRQIIHHVAHGERYYSNWIDAAYPEDPPARYREARRRFSQQFEKMLANPPVETLAFIDGENLFLSAEQIAHAVLEAENQLRAS